MIIPPNSARNNSPITYAMIYNVSGEVADHAMLICGYDNNYDHSGGILFIDPAEGLNRILDYDACWTGENHI